MVKSYKVSCTRYFVQLNYCIQKLVILENQEKLVLSHINVVFFQIKRVIKVHTFYPRYDKVQKWVDNRQMGLGYFLPVYHRNS